MNISLGKTEHQTVEGLRRDSWSADYCRGSMALIKRTTIEDDGFEDFVDESFIVVPQDIILEASMIIMKDMNTEEFNELIESVLKKRQKYQGINGHRMN